MDKQNDRRPSLKINGASSAPGGLYKDVVINGDARVEGDVECESFKVNGTASINGKVTMESGRINGTTSFKSDLTAGEFKIFGTADISGNLTGGKIRIEGSANMNNISADEIKLHGAILVKGDCNAENFQSFGGFSVGGLLNAGTIDINLFAPCKAKEIGGEKITVRRSTAFKLAHMIKSFFVPKYDGLTAECVEGDDIYLEYTRAKIVRGNNINLGPECEIELVEYNNTTA